MKFRVVAGGSWDEARARIESKPDRSGGVDARRRSRRSRLRVEALEDRRLLTGVVAEYPIPTAQSNALDITRGPDGNLWFTESAKDNIARITPTGVVTEFPTPTSNSAPGSIAAGSDGNLWFTEFGAGKIGRITPAGVIIEFPVPDAVNIYGRLVGITAGPDGNLWFIDNEHSTIGRITTAGVVTEFPQPTTTPITQLGKFTAGPDGSLWFTDQLWMLWNPSNGESAGPDGNLWFTDPSDDRIGRSTPTGVITYFSTQAPAPSDAFTYYSGITVGPDGNLWFTEPRTNQIGRITPAGVVTSFAIPTTQATTIGGQPTSTIPLFITAGPDGNLYFTEATGDQIGQITPDGVVTEFPIPTANSGPTGIATGPDGNLYFAETNGNKIGVFDPFAAVVTPVPVTVVPVTVTSIERYGYHALPTTIVLQFSGALDPASAQNVANYTLVGPKKQSIAVATATYSATTDTVTLSPRHRLNVHRTYHLTVNGSSDGGVASVNGTLIDGADDGMAGSNHVASIDMKTLVIPGHTVKDGKVVKAASLVAVKQVHPTRAHAHR